MHIISCITPIYGHFAEIPSTKTHIAVDQNKTEKRPLKCPYCAQDDTRVIDTSHDQRGGIRRRRVCGHCEQRFTTYERPILATPMIVKRDGTREEFSREKVLQGVRLACVKRPVPATDIEQLVGEVEAELQQLGRAEVSSRQVGDRIIAKLKEMDEVAYIRFAIVYLRLGDVGSIRNEIDRLLKE
jgi:transcriptional repressor NrdR